MKWDVEYDYKFVKEVNTHRKNQEAYTPKCLYWLSVHAKIM